MGSAEKFSRIYETHRWGGTSRSGPGSDAEKIQPYLVFLQNFLDQNTGALDSVLDLGCGDWAFSRKIDWGSVHYTGLDVVPSLIDENRRKFGSATKSFSLIDITKESLPQADILISKDVLQHLSNADVNTVLGQLENFKAAIITNDVDRFHMPYWPIPIRRSVSRSNEDIDSGGWRTIKLDRPPFRIESETVLVFEYRLTLRTVDRKATEIWKNPESGFSYYVPEAKGTS